MRPGQHNKRGRNRHRSGGGGGGGGNNAGGNPLNRVYDSNGPDVKVRGTAQTITEKYMQLGRDAQLSGDHVMAEMYYQYAEHYYRILTAAQAYNQQMQPQQPPPQYRRPGDEYEEEEESESAEAPREQSTDQPEVPGVEAFAGDRYQGERQPQADGQPMQAREPREPYQQNRDRDRERHRPRWQDRRDQQQGSQMNGNEPRQNQRDSNQNWQPREANQNAAPAPAPQAEAESAAWEAPSFLKRPAPLPVSEEASGNGAASAEQPAERRPRERRPRREKPAETSAEGAPPPEPAVVTPGD